LATPWLLSGSIGFVAAVGGFLSEEGTEVSTPGNCEPGDFGRSECEPSAGPRKGNAGTSGAYNPRTGNSRETDGGYASIGIPVTIGLDILRGDFGSIALNAIFEPSYTALLPSDGDGTGYWNLSGGGEVVARFGGAEAHVAKEKEEEAGDKDGDGVRDAVDSCPDDAGPGTPDGCPEPGDKDGDGVSDDEDKCPRRRGLQGGRGLPVLRGEHHELPRLGETRRETGGRLEDVRQGRGERPIQGYLRQGDQRRLRIHRGG
jgi:hypothetical protein